MYTFRLTYSFLLHKSLLQGLEGQGNNAGDEEGEEKKQDDGEAVGGEGMKQPSTARANQGGKEE